MEITWLGILLIPLGVLLLFVAPRALYRATIFSIPFTATSLLNTATGVPLTPVIFFGLLFIISRVLVFLMGHFPRRGMGGDRSLVLLFLFLAVVVLSMLMPLIIDGSLSVSTNQLNDLYKEPLRLTEHNIKNPFPVIFFVGLSVFWIWRSDTSEKIRSTLKTYVAAGVFVSLWGCFQFFCNAVGIDYPYRIFNNAVLDSMKGYEQLIEIDGRLISRVSSVAHEPSIFAKYLLTVFPIMLVSVLMRNPLFSRRWDKIILVLLILTLAITTSSTAYIGIVIVMALSLMLLSRFYSLSRVGSVLVAIIAVAFGSAILWVPALQQFLIAMIFLKFESGSALERVLSIATSWEYFLEYPILGVGWAVVTSHDLLVYLLASTGIVGLVTFIALIWYVIRHSVKTLASLRESGKYRDMFVLVAALTISLATLIITGVLTGLEFYLGYFYFILSMLIASNVAAARMVPRGNQVSLRYGHTKANASTATVLSTPQY